ncbi:Nuclear/nucleolar GTPase 2 [Cocos nucifera]|uniref:Nuclear/nucleolar GTPase 2 n=1 Tax=Cocos nucifera TaxID=13894 RepID=A0A8K0N744_COCNU|nr:Nuclear/nucleolar GTPase 2 [Cocos nucifera]
MAKKKEKKVNVSGKPKYSLDVNRSNRTDTKGARTAVTVRWLKMYNSRPKLDSKGKILKHELQSKELPNTRIEPDRRWSQAKAHLLDTVPFEDAFGPKRKRKHPKLLACDYESLVKKADGSQDAFEQKSAARQSWEEDEEYGLRDLVLDARDPQQTRCHHLEKHLKEHCKHKHMILLLNKGSLLSVLRQFGHLKSDKQAISVGFVGYPNVGKSSVINTLCTKNVCKVAPIPGETKVWQYITLTKGIFLIDCPGVVVDENDFLVQLCRSTGKLLKVMDVDEELNFLWMIFREVEDEPSEKSDLPDASKEPTSSTDRTAAAMKAIAGIISSQQLMNVPAHKDFFNGGKTETEKIEHPQEDASPTEV